MRFGGKINGLDLFSGFGGAQDALGNFVKPLAYCEIETGAQRILLRRMRKGQISVAPIWDDVRTLHAGLFKEPVDIITGGFPCQDISVAGNGKGVEGERSGLFREVVRLTRELNPAFVFLENVPAIRTRGAIEVVRAFDGIGYDCRWTVVSAQEVGAPHVRKRWWMLAHARSSILRQQQGWGSGQDGKDQILARDYGEQKSLAAGVGQRLEGRGLPSGGEEKHANPSVSSWWEVEPAICRVVDWCPDRRDRIRALGNGWVPQSAKEAFKRLLLGESDEV